jgi:Protein of unknown function (DUF4065)
MAEIRYDKRKFSELLLYVADRCADDPGYGATKLNKLLFFCDFLAYAHLGQPISGAKYQKLRWGPAPTALLPVQQELEREGVVKIVERARIVYRQRLTLAQRPPDLSAFEPNEIELIDEVLDLFRHADAGTISDISHRVSAGWNLVEEGEEIPYETALISMDPPPAEAIEMGREVAQRLRW